MSSFHCLRFSFSDLASMKVTHFITTCKEVHTTVYLKRVTWHSATTKLFQPVYNILWKRGNRFTFNEAKVKFHTHALIFQATCQDLPGLGFCVSNPSSETVSSLLQRSLANKERREVLKDVDNNRFNKTTCLN